MPAQLKSVTKEPGAVAIDKGIPLPDRKGGGQTKWPWKTMELGDSFFVPDRKIVAMGSQASHTGRILGRRFTCRTVEGGVRVWRIE